MGQLTRTIALVGMMGAGKSSIGRRLAARLYVPFHDTDAEVERAAGCSIPEIFQRYGEAAFRDCERKVISRLLGQPPHVLATGGGAYMDAETRSRIKDRSLAVWIRAPVDILLERVQRKDNRPLLKGGDPRETLERLLAEREPVYAEAELAVESDNGLHDDTVDRIVGALAQRGIWMAP